MQRIALNTDNATAGFMRHFSPKGDLSVLCFSMRNSSKVSKLEIYGEIYEKGRPYWGELELMAKKARA